MPIGTSEGEHHEDDTSFHLDPMFNDTVYDDSPTEQQYMRTTGGIATYDYLKNEERGMEARHGREVYGEPEDQMFGNHSTDYTPVDYKNWLNEQSKKLGRDLFFDTHSYDLEGYYKKYGSKDLTGEHLTDEFKRPSHITFSNESVYHNTSEDIDKAVGMSPPDKKHEGGQWEKLDDGSWTFTPGRTNLKEHTTQELIDYFKKYEKGNHLLLPGS